jgi:cytochrome P450
VQEYGSTITYKGLGSIHRLYTTDLKAINYILMNSDDFGKPLQVRFNLGRIFGPGILIVEGEQHRQQRRILNPAFGPAQIRELTPIFTEKADQLRDIWSAKIAKEDGRIRADVLSWLSKLTLDVIGLAGFHYKFDTLNADAKPNELYESFNVLFRTGSDFSLLPFLQGYFPIFRFIVTEQVRITRRAKEKMDQIGMQLLRESKAAAIAGDHKDVLERRDLLSLLTRANMDKELPESQRLSDEDVLARE